MQTYLEVVCLRKSGTAVQDTFCFKSSFLFTIDLTWDWQLFILQTHYSVKTSQECFLICSQEFRVIIWSYREWKAEIGENWILVRPIVLLPVKIKWNPTMKIPFHYFFMMRMNCPWNDMSIRDRWSENQEGEKRVYLGEKVSFTVESKSYHSWYDCHLIDLVESLM